MLYLKFQYKIRLAGPKYKTSLKSYFPDCWNYQYNALELLTARYSINNIYKTEVVMWQINIKGGIK